MAKRFWKGTSKPEIAFYTFVLLGLIGLTWPYFHAFQCRAMQSEAILLLQDAHKLESYLFATENSYKPIESLIENGRFLSPRTRFILKTRRLTGNGYILVATSESADLPEDRWSIDENQNLTHEFDGCSG